MSTTYTITGKMSGTGTIHDLAAEYDREIKFRGGTKYAVVLIAYYGHNLYTTHRTAEAAIRESKKQTRGGWEHVIIDSEGAEYKISGYYNDQLIPG
jgi:hypothetical protein